MREKRHHGDGTGPAQEAGARAAPRMDLCLPGKFLAVDGNRDCILVNLSKTGGMIVLSEPMKIGADGYLRCGPIDHFMVVRRKGYGRNALSFDIPVSDAFVFGVRKFQETLEWREQQELLEVARAWTTGAKA